MAFAQLTYRESLRDIEACLRAMDAKLYHMGIRGNISRTTLADANESRDWRIYADFAMKLIATARPMYAHESLGFDLDHSLYALDSTTIDLCLALFPWARFRAHKRAVKVHTLGARVESALLDLHGNIPSFISITDGKVYDVNILDEFDPEPGAFYAMDRAYIDFVRLYRFALAAAFFVLRSKTNIEIQRRYSHPVDKSTGVRADQTVILTSLESAKAHPNLDRHAMPGDTLAALNRLAPALVQFRKNFSGTPIPDWPNWKSPSGRPSTKRKLTTWCQAEIPKTFRHPD